ncbi:hypothetical protein AVEN_81346-1 [Araneus ventricosus]|uniref:Uncharacterized protein n=1 Tax=Araneus ventricosus TaxID=182803 RepID=A0A4Y2B8T7_ARAVE|nr:hypothetical protein AVEN_81346-1 [Araneus ventricosus]
MRVFFYPLTQPIQPFDTSPMSSNQNFLSTQHRPPFQCSFHETGHWPVKCNGQTVHLHACSCYVKTAVLIPLMDAIIPQASFNSVPRNAIVSFSAFLNAESCFDGIEMGIVMEHRSGAFVWKLLNSIDVSFH